MAYMRERMAAVKKAVERSAERVGGLERQLYRTGEGFGRERRMQVERLRAELRAARREFREARSHWRMLAPLPALASTMV
jgi:recombinational DNA repair ATPase RecF